MFIECTGKINVLFLNVLGMLKNVNVYEIFMQSENRKNIENIIADLIVEKKDLERILK